MLWKREDYLGSRHDYVRYYSNPRIPQDKYLNISEVCKFMVSNDPDNKLENTNGETENYLPTKQLYVPGLNKNELVQRGLLNVADSGKVSDIMKFTLPKNALYKNDIAMLNIIAAIAGDGWKRPIYFNGDYPGSDNTLGMGSYMKQEGLVYRLVPYTYTDTTKSARQESITDIDKSYNLFMNTYIWGGADRNDVYFDEKNRYMFMAYRVYAARIADKLSEADRTADAVKLLDKVMSGITMSSYPYDVSAYYMAVAYYHAGAKEKAADLSMKIARNCEDDIKWINTLDDTGKESELRDARTDLSLINSLSNIAHETGDEATAVQLNQEFKMLYASIRSLIESKNNAPE